MFKCKTILTLIAGLFFFGIPLFSAVHYVSTNGTGTWTQSTDENSPCSMQVANANASAGDTIYIMAGTYNTYIAPANSGTSAANTITYCNYKTDTVTISNAAYGILLNGKSYIVVQGIDFYNLDKFLWLQDSANHNTITYCNFDQGRNIGWSGSKIYRNSSFNRVIHCRFSKYGYYTHDDIGSVLDVGNENTTTDLTSNNLLENCVFFHGGHHILGVYGMYNVIRNCYFHNEPWAMGTSASDRGAVLYGNRNISVSGYVENSGRNLFEGNSIAYSSDPSDNEGASGMSLTTSNNIVRKNRYYNNISAGLSLTLTSSYYQNIRHNKIYNNSFFNNGNDPATWIRAQTGIFFAVYSGLKVIEQNVIKNNVLFRHNTPFSGYNIHTPDRSGLIELQTFENNWDGDTEGDPMFADANIVFGDPADPTWPVFNLTRNSPCIDAGGSLTTITSASGSGISFTVDDAGYFMDGWDIVDGDIIQLEGQTQTAQITEVDYETNIITVDISLTWNQGQGISLSYKGSAPDAGAYEYGTTGNIAGTVTDSISGNPLEGATVTNGIGSDETDSEGNFTIEYVTFNQAYTVTATKSGYFPLSIDSVVVFAAEDSTTVVDFQLTKVPAGTISGTVTDSITGNPLQGALITDGIRSDTTDISGSYTFADVPVDTFTLTVSISDYLPLSVVGVVVTDDSTTVVDFQLLRVPTGTITGNVTDAVTSNPIEGALVSNGTSSDTTDDGGSYTFPEVLIDTFTITVSTSGYMPLSIDGVVVTKNDTNTVDFQLTPFPDLVGFWAFEESSDTIAYDSSANHNDGIIHGPTSTSGMSELALQFDGTDDYVTIPKSVSLDDIDKEITLMAWIRVSSGSRHSIFERWLSGVDVEERSFLLDVKKDQVYFGLSGDGTNSDSRFLLSSGSIPEDTWTHVAATSDGSEMKIYINGVPDPETKTSPLSIHPSAADLHIGQGEFVTNGWDYPFNGIMDQVKIYNRALNAQEVEADYQLAFVGFEKNLAPENGVLQAYPNPFNDETTISYKTTVTGRVGISIYNMSGQIIRFLVSATQQADKYTVVWDGTKTGGEPAGSGIYFCTFSFDGEPVVTKKLVLIR